MIVITSRMANGTILIQNKYEGEPIAITQELAAAIADIAAEFELAEGKTPVDLIRSLADFAIEFLPQALERKKARKAAQK